MQLAGLACNGKGGLPARIGRGAEIKRRHDEATRPGLYYVLQHFVAGLGVAWL